MSTNDRAKALAMEGAPDRSIVFTPRQTAGRGRGSNRWWSDRGTLTFSIITSGETPVSPAQPASISLVTAICVIRAILSIDPKCPVGVKWPNDIYSVCAGRKVGGILVENCVRAGRRSFMIVGIGLNVNSEFKTAPRDIQTTATSLRLLSGRKWDGGRLLERLLSGFFDASRQFHRKGFEPFLEEWYRFDVVPLGSRIVLENGDRRDRGLYAGINPSGAARFSGDFGRIRTAISGTLLIDPGALRPC